MKYINVIMFLLFYWVSQVSFLHINSSFIYIYIFFLLAPTRKMRCHNEMHSSWATHSLHHELQKDGSSCGVLILKVGLQKYLSSVKILFMNYTVLS